MAATTLTAGEIEERIARLIELPYRKVIQGDAVEGYLATVLELPGCVTAGATETEALEMLHDAMAGWFASNLARCLPIPEPVAVDPEVSGRVLVRMPKSLHQRLLRRAAEEGISANQLAVTTLARGLG
jgi:antitoxin HicB